MIKQAKHSSRACPGPGLSFNWLSAVALPLGGVAAGFWFGTVWVLEGQLFLSLSNCSSTSCSCTRGSSLSITA